MYEDIKLKSSPLKYALDERKSPFVNKLMEACIQQDKYGLLYFDYFSPYLKELKDLAIDLKPLFSSRILFHKIDNRNAKFDESDLKLKYCIKHSNETSLYYVLYSDQKLIFDEKDEECPT